MTLTPLVRGAAPKASYDGAWPWPRPDAPTAPPPRPRIETLGGRDLGPPVGLVIHIGAGRDKVPVEASTAASSHDLYVYKWSEI